MNKVTLSKGQVRRNYIYAFSTLFFIVSNVILIKYCKEFFGTFESDITTFDILKNLVPFTLGISATLCTFLVFVFGRESLKALPKGFYTPTSWLDVKHSNLVMIDEGKLVQFDISEHKFLDVQTAFQAGEGIESLFEKSGADEQKVVVLSDCTKVESEHNSHDINIEHNETSETFVFVSPIVKTHALSSIKAMLPKSLDYNKAQISRLQASVPYLIALIVIATIVYFMSGVIINALLITIGVFTIFPILIKRFLFPPIVESWNTSDMMQSSH